jgi:hypothetical protein
MKANLAGNGLPRPKSSPILAILRHRETVSMRRCCAVFLTFVILSLCGTAMAMAAETKTSKERLSDKASDEQRVDDCRVPVARRGASARPGCAADPRRSAQPILTPANSGQAR